MTYFVKNQIYRTKPDDNPELLDEYTYPHIDEDGTALSQAEDNYYARLISELTMQIDEGNDITETPDILFIQNWYTDAELMMPILTISITNAELISAFQTQIGNIKPINKDLQNAVLLHEQVVDSVYDDVVWTKEKLFRNQDGVYILETIRRIGDKHRTTSADTRILRDAEACKWGRKYMPQQMYKNVFAPVEEDPSRTPVVLAMRQDMQEKLAQYTLSTGKKASVIVEEALNQFFNDNTRQ